MKESFAYVLEFMPTLGKMQDNSTLLLKNSKSEARAFLKVIKAFQTVPIVLYIGCSGPVVRSLTDSN